MKLPILTLFLFALLSACAPSRFVKPLEEGQKVVNVSVGGPVINLFGGSFPTPLTSVTYGQGLSDNLTVFGSLHTTALFFGTVQTEVGLVKTLIPHKEETKYWPGLSASPVLNFAVDTWEGNAKLWPELDVNAWWNLGQNGSYVYTGVGNWFELAGKRAHEEPQPTKWLWNPHAGAVFNRDKWQYNLELKYLAPNQPNNEVVVDYSKVFGQKGALGAYFSITRKL